MAKPEGLDSPLTTGVASTSHVPLAVLRARSIEPPEAASRLKRMVELSRGSTATPPTGPPTLRVVALVKRLPGKATV